MTDQKTVFSDIYDPTLFSQMFLEEMTNKNALVQSGIAAPIPEFEAAVSQGGLDVELPFWDDLSTSDHAEVPTDTTTEATPTGITTDKDVAVKLFFTKVWNSAPVLKYANTGGDPVKHILSRYVKWWTAEEQYIMLNILKGIFSDSTIASVLSEDISTEDGDNATSDNLFSIAASETARFKLGDAYDKLTAMCVHSTVLQRMRALNTIDYVADSDQKLTIPMYNGLRVLVDDNMTTEAGSTSGTKYYTYLFGEGAFARNPIPLQDPAFEWYRSPLKGVGGGADYIITRWYSLLHPRGIKWAGSLTSGNTGPTVAQLAADNWTQAYQTKNIRITRLITNG